MFNDRYGLTQAVLEGRKTMTRRIIYNDAVKRYSDPWDLIRNCTRYHFDEVVAIAQSYSDVLGIMIERHGGYGEEQNEFYEKWGNSPAWGNKMFVAADLMPNHIKITDIKVERLQDISREDLSKEGIEYDKVKDRFICGDIIEFFQRDAFAALIDKVLGKGTWESNPWCFCYEFKLIESVWH